MTTVRTIVRHLSEDQRAAIEDSVADWCLVSERIGLSHSEAANRREAYSKIINDMRAGYSAEMAVANLDDDRWAMKHMHELAAERETAYWHRAPRSWE